jgi:hypothetical protein
VTLFIELQLADLLESSRYLLRLIGNLSLIHVIIIPCVNVRLVNTCLAALLTLPSLENSEFLLYLIGSRLGLPLW